MKTSQVLTLIIAFYLLLASASSQAAVLVKAKMWPANTTLNVVFLDGNQAQKQLVRDYAPLWLQDSSLAFSFFDSFSSAPAVTHIRISFLTSTGSVLGNHGEFGSKEATMQLAELADPELPEDFARRLVLHEFGHALGFEHEYRNPKWPYGQAPIEQHIQRCQPRMQSIGYLPTQATKRCKETNQTVAPVGVNSTIYDEYSVMNYPQQIELADSSQKVIEARTHLSVLDKLAMQRWYGKQRL